MYAITLTEDELKTLQTAFLNCWHSLPNSKAGDRYAALLDKIEQQAGVYRTQLGVPSDLK